MKPGEREKPQLVLEVGTLVAGEYRVDRMLAEGTMSLFVVATHVHSEQPVTLGLLRGEMGSRWDAMDRFADEANAAVHLRSEHVARVLEAGVTAEGAPYIVMEPLEGRTLAWELEVHGPFDVARATEYVIQACEGLAEAHAQGIVHRDVNPSSLFLIPGSPGYSAVKIVDFGISNFGLSDTADFATDVTVGTPCYLAPEQLRATAMVDHRGDIWSLGATLYELLTGQPAFRAAQTPALDAAILEKPATLGGLRADIPEELTAVVSRCLAKDREARFQSVGDLAMALLPFAPARARIPAERAASRTPAWKASAAARGAKRVDPHLPVRAENGPSLLPTSRTVVQSVAAPLPAVPGREPRDQVEARSQVVAEPPVAQALDGDLPWSGVSPWVRFATLAAAVVIVFAAILVAATDDASEARGGGDPDPSGRAGAAAQTATEAPAAAILGQTDPVAPEVVALVVSAFPASARITIDGRPVAGNPFRASYPKSETIYRIEASAEGYNSKSQDVLLASDVVVRMNLDPQSGDR